MFHGEWDLAWVPGAGPAVARGVFGAGCSFRVGWRAAGGGEWLSFCFSMGFCWYWWGFHFGRGTGR